MMKKALVTLATAAVVMAAPLSCAGARVVDRIIARINNEIVTQRQFDRQKEQLRGQLAQQYSGAELEQQVREQSKNLLRDMIDQALMVQKAKDDDINVETDVVKELDRMRAKYNLNSLEDLQKEVEKSGQVWEDFKDNIRRGLLMREVIGREVRIIISREDARKYFKAHADRFASPPGVHLAEILISTDKHKPAEAEPRAKDALAEIKAGQRWEDVVKKYSDAESAKDAGDVGFFKLGTLAPPIEEAIKKLDVNDTTDLIKTKYGYEIIKVLERRSAGTPAFEEVENQVMNVLYNEKMEPALRIKLTELRKESFVYLAPGFIDTGGAPGSSGTETAERGE